MLLGTRDRPGRGLECVVVVQLTATGEQQYLEYFA